jgi:hypothetical protein
VRRQNRMVVRIIGRDRKGKGAKTAVLTKYRVFELLARAQPHHRLGLGLDLDLRPGLRVAADARLAVRFHDAADVRDDELARTTLGLPSRRA